MHLSDKSTKFGTEVDNNLTKKFWTLQIMCSSIGSASSYIKKLFDVKWHDNEENG